MKTIVANNEERASAAFTSQSGVFDSLYSEDLIIQYKRSRVREHLTRFLKPKSKILELNSGTGEDALWFAKSGHSVRATDISTGMQDVLKMKAHENGLEHLITQEICSFTQLENLIDRGPYDLIFSNFAGLNCTEELGKVLSSFSKLLVKGGHVTLVVMPGFCLWESLMVFKGKFRTATRRWFSSKGADAKVEGQSFKCWYYSPSYVKQQLSAEFRFVGLEGLCTIVPPSYIERFGEKHPKLFHLLKAREDKWKSRWPWRNIGDYYIITFTKL